MMSENDVLSRQPSGVYVEDHVKFEGESKEIEIDSDIIYHEILNNPEKVFDVLEIFVKLKSLKKLPRTPGWRCRDF